MRSWPVVVLAFLLCVSSAMALQVARPRSAAALDNGLALTPPMGFNDWNAFGCNVSAQLIEQTADAMVANGMKAAGYQYVNIDDCWALPERDVDGNLVPDPAKFPEGIKAVADYVHADGLKLGIYNDSGTHTCSKSHGFPGSLGHEYQDALQFARWGVDYLKDDDCNQPADQQNVAATIQRYETQRDALAQAAAVTGHKIVFSICEKTDFGVPNSAWPEVGNLWRTTGDIHDTFASMVSNFHKNVLLSDLAKPGAWNDPDMLEIGNGGQSAAEYRSEFSLWSEMAAPLIAGTPIAAAGGKPAASADTLAIYENKDVIAVDQDPLGKQANIVSNSDGHWVLSKPLANGAVAVALFNETDSPATITTTAAQAGLGKANAYNVRDLWRHTTTESAGNLTAVVAPHATVMYRVSAGADPDTVAPHTALSMTGLDDAQAGQPVTVTATFTDDGRIPAENLRLSFGAPADWHAGATSATSFPGVGSGKTVRASWQVTEPPADAPFPSWTFTMHADYVWGPESTAAADTATETITRASPVQPPYHTYASTTAAFGQGGTALGIRAAGADVYGSTNEYGAIYLPNAEQDGTTDTVKITAQSPTDEWAKAGIIVRNDITQSGVSPGFVILAVTPGHGYVLQWDANGDGRLDSNSAPSGQGSGTTNYPSWLKLTRSGSTFTGYYSTDGATWTQIGTANVPSAAASQDAGVFMTAHSSSVGESDFTDLQVGPPSGLLDAAKTVVTLPGRASTVDAGFWNHGSNALGNVNVQLAAPDGWTVTPSTPTTLGTVPAGAHANAEWQVSAPADAPPGSYPLTITATYADGGHTAHSQASVAAVVPSTDLSGAYDNVGITDDSNTNLGNIDGPGSSLSAQALQAVGVTPRAPVSHNGMVFAWPDVPAGQPDNVLAHGQSLQLSGSGSSLGFLTTATYGPATGTGTITYSDGTTQQFSLTVPDWYSNPPSGSDVAITMSYRNRPNNTQQTHDIHVFLVKVPLQAGKTPVGLTLPDVSSTATSGLPALHVFGVAVGN
jgi:hypothetical protein